MRKIEYVHLNREQYAWCCLVFGGGSGGFEGIKEYQWMVLTLLTRSGVDLVWVGSAWRFSLASCRAWGRCRVDYNSSADVVISTSSSSSIDNVIVVHTHSSSYRHRLINLLRLLFSSLFRSCLPSSGTVLNFPVLQLPLGIVSLNMAFFFSAPQKAESPNRKRKLSLMLIDMYIAGILKSFSYSLRNGKVI